MKIPKYTLVVGVDWKHLQQLAMVWPTWRRHKPSLLNHPMIVFRDGSQVSDGMVRAVVNHHPNLSVYHWPMGDARYGGVPGDKWSDPQRYKMLAGFVHIPAMFVKTPYWFKLDTDTVAAGQPDWIDPLWFKDEPSIISHAWSFTKPADQMMKLDDWVERNSKLLPELSSRRPLNLRPRPGSDRVGHKRIISWCSFFNLSFTVQCATMANQTCGLFQLPVPSQDGFMWYVATRLGDTVRRVQMKQRGWEHWLTQRNIDKAVRRVLWLAD